MNTIFSKIAWTAVGVACMTLAACDSDIEKVYVQPSDATEMGGATGPVILTPSNTDGLALTLYWNADGTLTLSDPSLQGPVNAWENTIQLSADAAFASPLELSVAKGRTSRQLLGGELNSLLTQMGFEANVMSKLYIRLRSVLAANVEPRFSNVLEVEVQPFRIMLNLATVLDKDHNMTEMHLSSPAENGVYTGFMGVAGWYNWFLLEANNVEWGNLGEGGKTFYASSASDKWNFWFPDPAGSYFTTVNTVEGWWSAMHLDNVTVGGDLSGEMTFSQKTNQWTAELQVPAAGSYNLIVSGKSSLYNTSTTDMGPAVEGTFGFGGNADALVFGTQASAVAVQLPAGAVTVVLNLSDPDRLTLGAGEAPVEPEPDNHLYFSGLVTWDGFDDYLTLYDSGANAYGGAHYIDSEWGYRAYPQPDWNPAYKGADDATPLAGTLVVAESDGNIPAPEKGLYVMDFEINAMRYNLTRVENVTFTGLNDDWSETPMVQSSDNPEIFTGEFVKTKETPWGVKVLINHDWGLFFGGGEGTLMLGHSDATTGFDGDNALEIGKTYILTVDLGRQTYTYTEK